MIRLPSRGFTLLEVLVALAIVAIALTALVKGGAESANNASYLQQKTFAHWVAMNKATQYQIQKGAWPSTGRASGVESMVGQQWEWTAKFSTVPVDYLKQGLQRMELEVRLEGTEGSLARIDLFRYSQ